MSREQTKAAHYIQQLDEARCQGRWDEVPELVRKVRKHAPDRTCLTLTAEAEHAVTAASQMHNATARPRTARPSTAASPETASPARYIPLLLEAIEKERMHVEDEFQAQVCLGWIHWQLGSPSLAVANLPRSIEDDYSQLDGTNKESAEWTKVCALKASYIKGTSQNKTGAAAEALETFDSALPVLTSVAASQKQGKEFKCWTELFLTGFCSISSLAVKTKVSSVLESETLVAFRAWAKFWDTQGPAPIGGQANHAEVSRRHVWREYYITLSDLLIQGLPFPTTVLTTAFAQPSTRLQQRAELKRVEAKYETLLLKEVQFPKAQEASEEVESFVDIVMQNWQILCGSTWQDEDLGEGGSEAVSRGVLDILYRAATKTFHSTAILRHLFTVHLAVAEFTLAFKAFDTYIEIVKKGKARVEKTGEPEEGLDDDETVLKAVSECIKALCRYGSREGAEKAKDLGQFFEDWLDKVHPVEKERTSPPGNEDVRDPKNHIAPRIFALAWRCIGIGHAQWARVTYDASARGEIQLHAIRCFRKALLPQFESTTDVETIFSFGTILAERRELSAAIEVVKSGLLPSRPSAAAPEGLGPHPGRFARERSLITLWHLMALLLSARQEFITAARSCEGAFEQFQDPSILFGDGDLSGSYRSEHLNSNEKAAYSRGIIDEMDDSQKENVLEVKMTQLALIEVLEGPEIAVNACDELLSLYSRLFGDPNPEQANIIASPTPSTLAPLSSAGTMKSIKGSIFGRSNRSVRKSNTAPTISESSFSTLRPQTGQTTATAKSRAPTIQVTNANGSTEKKHHKGHHEHEKLHKKGGSLNKKESLRNRSPSAPQRNISGPTAAPHVPTTLDGEKFFTPPVDTQNREQWLSSEGPRASQVGLAISPDQLTTGDSSGGSPLSTLPPKSQQMGHKELALQPSHPDPALAQSTRPPHVPHTTTTNPIPRFPQIQARRRKMKILVKVWLLISGFYRRAAMYDDARGAIAEAFNLVERLESEVSNDTSGNVSTSHPGWGGGKSVGELWGDIYSERGALAVVESAPYTALAQFESALSYTHNHPSAIVGLSNILLDIYTEDLLPAPSIPSLNGSGPLSTPSASTLAPSPPKSQSTTQPIGPLGLPSAHATPIIRSQPSDSDAPTPTSASPALSPNTTTNSDSTTALLDRLAARDRAYGLLSGLTKLGTGWNHTEAWFSLARAYELGGEMDRAREVLWWCVELEEGRPVRGWEEVSGGYVL